MINNNLNSNININCIFCKIIFLKQQKDKDILLSTKNFIVIRDKFPKYKIHFLILPKIHFDNDNILNKTLKNNNKKKFNNLLLNLTNEILNNIIFLKKINLSNGFSLKINFKNNKEIQHTHIHLYSDK